MKRSHYQKWAIVSVLLGLMVFVGAANAQVAQGTLRLTCDMRNTTAADILACRVSIDGAVQAADLVPGQVADYLLDAGPHTVVTEIVGENAALWDPASRTSTVTINANAVNPLRPRFDKKGHLTVTLNQPGVLADIYIDGVLVATQVATTDAWVTPNVSHRVEARNVTDPAAGGLYRWPDSNRSTTVPAAQERTLQIRLVKQWLKGFLNITCRVNNAAGRPATCDPMIDGVAMGSLLPGTTESYVLDPGAHTIVVSVGPAGSWNNAPRTFNTTIRAGRTSNITATFNLAAAPTPTPTPLPPPTPPPPPGLAHGIGNIQFSVRQSTYRVNEQVWFDFHIANLGGNQLNFGYLGAVVYNSNGQFVTFKISWQSWWLEPLGTLGWADWLSIQYAGTYYLGLRICYSPSNVCDTPSGDWENLSQMVPITVNW